MSIFLTPYGRGSLVTNMNSASSYAVQSNSYFFESDSSFRGLKTKMNMGILGKSPTALNLAPSVLILLT